MAIYKVTLFSIFDYLIFIVKILVTPTKTKKGVTNIVYLQTKTNELPLNLCKFSNGRLAKMSHGPQFSTNPTFENLLKNPTSDLVKAGFYVGFVRSGFSQKPTLKPTYTK